MAAFERETVASDELLEGNALDEASHALCKSAKPTPDTVPKGTKYQPKAGQGQDFETGDSVTGWKCLKFGLTQPHYYQYGYAAGSGYKGPARGLPDPGPAVAEAHFGLGTITTSLIGCTFIPPG